MRKRRRKKGKTRWRKLARSWRAVSVCDDERERLYRELAAPGGFVRENGEELLLRLPLGQERLDGAEVAVN